MIEGRCDLRRDTEADEIRLMLAEPLDVLIAGKVNVPFMFEWRVVILRVC
jgi:hypothetical protein